MLITFLNLFFGLLSGHRILLTLYQKKLIQKQTMTKIGTAYAVLTLIFVIHAGKNQTFAWFGVFFALILLNQVQLLLQYSRRKHFRREFLHLLNLVVLKMKAGRGLSHAIIQSKESFDPFFQNKISEIYNVVCFSQHFDFKNTDLFLIEAINELKKAHQSKQNSLQRIIIFRQKLKIEEDFRHRSRLITQQTRIQLYILCVFFISLLIYVVSQFGIKQNSSLILSSTALFLIGFVACIFIGRKKTWKV